MDQCSFQLCNEENLDIHRVTVDYFGCHGFCSNHWDFVCFLFNRRVIPCARIGDEKGCRRNHAAEYYKDAKVKSTTKFNGKYFDLCGGHLAMYDELLGVTITYDEFED